MDIERIAALMQSKDYRERFTAEYWQLRDRFLKLTIMLNKWDAGELEFTPDCPRELLDRQISAMADYIGILEERANYEGLTLDNELEISLRSSMLKPGDTRLNPARPLTNGGKIRNMDNHELAEFILSCAGCKYPWIRFENNEVVSMPMEFDACLEWLESEWENE